MVFQDWELMEEYFVAKGILPKLDSEQNKEQQSDETTPERFVRPFRIISRLR
jgi:hypothetical protein